jgi:hypothetical protein
VADREHLREAGIHFQLGCEHAHDHREAEKGQQDDGAQTEHEIFNTLQNNLPLGSHSFAGECIEGLSMDAGASALLFRSIFCTGGTDIAVSFSDCAGDPEACATLAAIVLLARPRKAGTNASAEAGFLRRGGNSVFSKNSQSERPFGRAFNYHDMPVWHSLIVRQKDEERHVWRAKH